MKKIYVLIIALITSANIFAQGIEFEHGTFSEVLEKAKKENKMIFVDCYTSWCGPCKMLARDIFPQKEVGDFFNDKFICVKFDCEKGEGVELAKKYEVKAYPTLLFIDTKGAILHKIVGGTDAGGLIAEAEIALDPSKRISALDKRYVEGDRDLQFLAQYIEALYKAYDKDKLSETGKEFIKKASMDQYFNANYFDVLTYCEVEYKSEVYNFLKAKKTKLISIENIGQQKYDEVIFNSILNYVQKIATNGTIDELDKAMEEVDGDISLADKDEIRQKCYSEYYFTNKEYKSWYEFNIKHVKSEMKDDEQMGFAILNQLAYKIAMSPIDVTLGIHEKVIQEVKYYMLKNEDKTSGYIILAYVYKATGNKDSALKNINEYIAIVTKEKGEIGDRVIKFKEEIEAM